jgi:hypothetical protein
MRIRDLAELVSAVSGAPFSLSLDPDAPETLRDRKIRDGKDARSYLVRFDKYVQHFPLSSNHRSLKTGVTQLIEFLRTMNLDAASYGEKSFYRLQQMERLVSQGLVDPRVFK